jgi:hypothetical protein
MPPDPNLIVQTVLEWVVPGLVIIVLGFPVIRLITRWLEPKPVPPRELGAKPNLSRADSKLSGWPLDDKKPTVR